AQQEGDTLNLRITGDGNDAKDVAGAVNVVNTNLNMAKNELPKVAQAQPMLKPIVDFVQTIECKADGKSAALTGSLKGEATLLLGLPMFIIGEARQAPQPPLA